MLAFVTILSSNRSSFLRGYQPARFPSPPPLPLISLKKWSVLIYQSPLQTWNKRQSITERTGHWDLDVFNGLISSFRGPSSLCGSYRKGKGEGGIRGKRKCKISCERYWFFSRLIPFLILHKCPALATRSLLSFFILCSTLVRGVELWNSPTFLSHPKFHTSQMCRSVE